MTAVLRVVDAAGELCHAARMTSGVLAFVGRERELAELRGGLVDAADGRGGLWLLAGEPGIGKSRLAEELARDAQRRGARTLWGRCWEAGGAPAFWPWIQVLRGALRDRAAPLSADRAAHLAQLLPELGGADGAPPLPPDRARFHLLDAVSATLCELGGERPLLVVLEDLHAADGASLTLLDFLAHQLRSSSVMVVGTYREADAHTGDAGALLLRIAQEARTIPLARLTPGEITAFLAGATGTEPDPDLVATVHRRTEGNPLFVVELARLFIAHGGLDADRAHAVPPTIRTAIRQRLDAAPPGTREVLELASVLGRDFVAAQLADSFDRELDDLRRVLDAAEAAALIIPVGPGAYRFSHILIREALHRDLPEHRRQELHLAAGRSLAGAHAPWSEIAHHLLAAGDAGRGEAVDAAARAAEQSVAALAFEDAVAMYRLALDAFDGMDGGGDRAARVRLLCGMGRAVIRAGELARGRALCRDAAAIARAIGEPELVAAAALAYGSELVFAEVDPVLVELLREALSLLPDADSSLRVQVMARLAAAEQPAPDSRGPIARARDAIAMARRLGDRAALLGALRAGCSAMMDLEDPAVRAPFNREHAALAEALGDPADALRGHHRSFVDCLELGDRAGAELQLDAVRRLAGALGHDYYRWRVAALDACVALWDGRFADAEAHTARARALGRQVGDANVDKTDLYQRARLYRLTGRTDELAAVIPELAGVLAGSAVAQRTGRVAAAALFIELGRADEAIRQLARESIDELLAVGDRTVFEPLAEITLAAGDAATARTLLATLRGQDGYFVGSGVLGCTWDGPMHRVLALCHRALGDHAAALDHYTQGIAACRTLRGEPMVAWLCAEAAATALARGADGDRERARAWAEEARELAARLGMATVLARAERLVGDRAAPPVAAVDPRPSFALRRDGDVWRVEHAGRAFRVKDSKGMRFLARLVDEPARELHALDLSSEDGAPRGAIDGGDAGAVLDERARHAYRARVDSLRDTLAEAEAWNDTARAEAARAELDQLTAELSRAVGLGGRDRRAGAAAERARINVTRRVRDAIRRIGEHDDQLARHLERSVRTGVFCSYDPA